MADPIVPAMTENLPPWGGWEDRKLEEYPDNRVGHFFRGLNPETIASEDGDEDTRI